MSFDKLYLYVTGLHQFEHHNKLCCDVSDKFGMHMSVVWQIRADLIYLPSRFNSFFSVLYHMSKSQNSEFPVKLYGSVAGYSSPQG